MPRTYDDESFAHVRPAAPPAVISVAATDAGFTSFTISLPAGVRRYHLTISPQLVDYELRFGSEVAGLVVPGGTLLTLPYPLSSLAVPSIKLAVGSPPTAVTALVSWPEE